MSPRPRLCRNLLRALRSAPFHLRWQPRNRIDFGSSAEGVGPLILDKAFVWLAPKLRVADELDLAPDLLIVDYGLGTIGLVHVILDPAGKSTAEQVSSHIDQAT